MTQMSARDTVKTVDLEVIRYPNQHSEMILQAQ